MKRVHLAVALLLTACGDGDGPDDVRVAGLPAIEFTASAVAGIAADVVIDPEEVFFDLPFDSLPLRLPGVWCAIRGRQ